MTTSKIKTYSTLIQFLTFEERFEYLKLKGRVGAITFGGHRELNQTFYRSDDWLSFRNDVIIRDGGCDLGDPDRPIHGKIYIHHLNPLTVDDILHRSSALFDLENVICTSFKTHQAIHYGDASLLPSIIVERTPNDTCPWR